MSNLEKTKYLWKVYPTDKGLDRIEYDCSAGFVVCAHSQQDCLNFIHSKNLTFWCGDECGYGTPEDKCFWRNPENAKVRLLGLALETEELGVVLRDFHAG
jgi:hypothetical protein